VTCHLEKRGLSKGGEEKISTQTTTEGRKGEVNPKKKNQASLPRTMTVPNLPARGGTGKGSEGGGRGKGTRRVDGLKK